jgi:hypothetical protein
MKRNETEMKNLKERSELKKKVGTLPFAINIKNIPNT